jgi:response regulator RpfG family c-di-GMP phosphodiesterase
MIRKHAPSILIVDDDEVIRGILRTCLDETYWCATAGTTEEAIKLLQSGSFNLVLSDITMPGASGLDLCRHIQQNCPRTVVVMISAMTDIEYAIDAMRQGAFDYITKPFDVVHVTLAVERALRFEQALEEKHRYEQILEERVRIRTDELGSANIELNSMLDTLYGNYRSTLRGLARALEARDVETRGHSDRVVGYSMRLGRKMGLGSKELVGLEQGALLHDIGKIGVRDDVLLKPGSLTTDEWVGMRGHVAHGLRIIEGVAFLAGAGFVVGQHHEKFDGSGYPNKLKGNEIHVCARIFAVADAFDAIMSDRPYRKGQSYERACEELRTNSGSQFDPRVVDAFMSIPKEEWEESRSHAEDDNSGEQLVDRREISSFILGLNPHEGSSSYLPSSS